jgi:hypothetical protein
MNSSKPFLITLPVCALLLSAAAIHASEPKSANNQRTKLVIQKEPSTGRMVITWNGKGVLKKAATVTDRFKPVHHADGQYIFQPDENVAMFRLEGNTPQDDTNVISINVVGYVNVVCPPGLSLIENPLKSQISNDVIGHLWPEGPDGLQAFKYGANLNYEVTTFDGLSQTWSNPDMDISTGIGFYVRNPTSVTITHTFVGEVLQGVLVNPLPEGFSTKGALVPISGSINSIHMIPGEPGDQLSIYINDLQGGGDYMLSTFSGTDNAWVPDLILNPGQGFWIQKQHAQDWIRVFYVN